MGGKRTTFQDPETGRWTRVCCDCKQTKDLELDFYKARRVPRGDPTDWNYQCKRCKVRQVGELAERQRQDPKRGPELRAMYTRLMREWRARNPERDHTNAKRYRERLRRDPQRHARYLETLRIGYRLRAERGGRKVRGQSTVIMARDHLPKLPARPLGDLLYEIASQNGGIKGLCGELGLNERTVQRWRHGQASTVQFDQVDKVLTALNLTWWDIWDREHYPEVWERLQ